MKINKILIIIDIVIITIITIWLINLQSQINNLKTNNLEPYYNKGETLDPNCFPTDPRCSVKQDSERELIEQIGSLKEKSAQLSQEIDLQQLNNIALQKEKWTLEQELKAIN